MKDLHLRASQEEKEATVDEQDEELYIKLHGQACERKERASDSADESDYEGAADGPERALRRRL